MTQEKLNEILHKHKLWLDFFGTTIGVDAQTRDILVTIEEIEITI